MGSTFSGLEIAKLGLYAQQAALYTTGHNIANANTEGYTRQRVNMEAAPAFPYPSAVNDVSPGQMGTGVFIQAIQRLREDYLDLQFRTENKYQGEWETKVDILKKIETFFNESDHKGLSSTIDAFWKSLQDLANNPADPAAREVVRNAGIDIGDTLQYLSRSLAKLQEDVKMNIQVKTNEAQTIVDQIVNLNKKIGDLVPHGYRPNDLYDQRDVLLDRLSKMMDITVKPVFQNGKDTGMVDVIVNNRVDQNNKNEPQTIDLIKDGVVAGNGITAVRKPINPKFSAPTDPYYYEVQINGQGVSQPGGVLGALIEAHGLPVEVTNYGVLPRVITSDPTMPVALFAADVPKMQDSSSLKEGDSIKISFNIPLKNHPTQLDAVQKAVDERFGEGNVKVTTSDYRTFTLTVNKGKTVNLAGGKSIELAAGTVQNMDGSLNNKSISFKIPDVKNPTLQNVTLLNNQTKNDGALKKDDIIELTFDRIVDNSSNQAVNALQNAIDNQFGSGTATVIKVEDKYQIKFNKNVELNTWRKIEIPANQLSDIQGNQNEAISFEINDPISLDVAPMNGATVTKQNPQPPSPWLQKGDKITLQFNIPLLNEPDQLKALQRAVDAKFGAGNMKVEISEDRRTATLTANEDGKVSLAGGVTLSIPSGALKGADGIPNNDPLEFAIANPEKPLATVTFGTNTTLYDGKLAQNDTFLIVFDRDVKDPTQTKTDLQTYFDNHPDFGSGKVQVTDQGDGKTFEVKVVDAGGLDIAGGLKIDIPAGVATTPAPTLASEELKADPTNTGTGAMSVKASGQFTGTTDETIELKKTDTGWVLNGQSIAPDASNKYTYNGIELDLSGASDAKTGDKWTLTLQSEKKNDAFSFALRDAEMKPSFESAVYEKKEVVLKGIVPSYQGRLDAFAVKMTEAINRVHTKTSTGADMAYDLDMINDIRNQGYTDKKPVNFFVSRKDPTRPPENASDVQVNPEILASINKIAAATKYTGESGGTSTSYKGDGTNARDMAALKFLDLVFPDLSLNNYGKPNESTTMDAFARYTVSKVGSETQTAEKAKGNSDVIMEHIDYQRQSVTGVSLDEEMSNMIKFQHAYNASARIINAMDEMLDKIINGMGLVGR